MRKANVKNATYIVKVKSNKGENRIDTIEIINTKTGEDLLPKKAGLASFNDLKDLKESLNWCLNCWPEKMSIEWVNTKTASYGTVYLVA